MRGARRMHRSRGNRLRNRRATRPARPSERTPRRLRVSPAKNRRPYAGARGVDAAAEIGFSSEPMLVVLLIAVLLAAPPARADETCMSPYMPKITGQEDYVYVWTLGVDGVGDGSDKLVTVGANPKSPSYGKVVSSVSVGGRHEAHHGGFTDDRRYFWAGGLDDSMIFVFDLVPDPSHPKLTKTIDSFVSDSGGVAGPHTFYALPGRMLIPALSNKDHTGKTAIVEYANDGKF